MRKVAWNVDSESVELWNIVLSNEEIQDVKVQNVKK